MRKLLEGPLFGSAVAGLLAIDAGDLKAGVAGNLGDLKLNAAVAYPVAKIVEPLYDHVVKGLEEKLSALGSIGVSGAELLEGLWQDGLKKISEAPAAPTEGQA